MSLVYRDTNVLDDKKEAVVTTSFLKKKVLTTEKVTTSDDVQKRTEKIKKVRRLFKVLMRFTNVLRRLKK